MEGRGKMIWTGDAGRWYKGDFVNNLFHGNGVYKQGDGSGYEGEWKKGERDGFGR